jgi:diguanylate cyclase (GGDEF)-like protein
MAGMHYTAMAAARFPEGSYCAADGALGLSRDGLVYVVVLTTLAVLAMALLTAWLDGRLETRTAQLTRSLRAANKTLSRLSLHDSLTGLPNRLLLGERIADAIDRATQHNTCFALLFIDLDGFKPINDALGHGVGDQLLVRVAERLRAGLRGSDTLARLSSDEFVALVSLRHPDEAMYLAGFHVVQLAQPFAVGEYPLQLSASIGIALFPGTGMDQHQLLVNAEAAMHHAKRSGKNAHCVFDASMNAGSRDQLQLIQDLRLAVQRDELCLVFQAKFDTVQGLPTGAEALVRWQHPRLGLLNPETFIELAEKTGMIVPIGEWVLNEACRQMAQWAKEGFEHWRVAVNLSAVQFTHAGLVQSVAHALAQNGLPARNLTLEVTETTAMSDPDASMAVLQQLADLGVDISIDDFGTGYSSLMYLKRLPANELKIDRGFVKDLPQDSDDAAIVGAIVALGQALGLRTVAEGVETPDQQAFLTRLGCDGVQGYLFGRPEPAMRFMAAIGAHTGALCSA